MKPSLPSWLEELCQRLSDNDPSLTSIELTHPRIDDLGARALAESLEDNTFVATLILSCYNIVDDGAYAISSVLGDPSARAGQTITRLQFRELRNSRDFVTFFKALCSNTRIEELSLRYSRVCLQGAVSFRKLLESHPRLHEVRLVDTQLSDGAIKEVCLGVGASPCIQRLFLVNAELEESDADHLANMLLDSRCGLRELHLAENDLGDAGAETIARALQSNESLRLLDLRSNEITENGALAIQGLLVSSQHLISLGLASNTLGSLGAAALARGLTHRNCVLQRLDLSDNEIGSGGACAFSHMLRYNQELVELNLGQNQLGDVGIQALVSGIASNKTLRWLSLRRNGLTNRGAIAFADKLPRMQGLKELILSKNMIDPIGATHLLKGLRSNVELEYLHLEDGGGRSLSSLPVHKEISHWIRLNKAGRRIFRHTNNVPHPIWAMVYGRVTADSNTLFHFLTSSPDVLEQRSETKTPNISSKKRKSIAG